jgi:hypothetical protein
VLGLVLPIPNPAARKQVLPFHDAHHLVTGYGTDWVGEAEVSAWALGSRGRSTWLASAYDGLGALGVLGAPVRVGRAYLRGRGCRNLYGMSREALLAAELEELEATAGIHETHATTARDRLALLRTLVITLFITPFIALPYFVIGCFVD